MSSSSAHPDPELVPEDDNASIHEEDAEYIYEEEEDDGSRPMDSDSDDGGEDDGEQIMSGTAMDSLRDLDGMRVEGDSLVYDPDGDMGGDDEEQEGEEGEQFVDNSVMQAGQSWSSLAALSASRSAVADSIHPSLLPRSHPQGGFFSV